VSLTWRVAITTAMPAVKPVVTGKGTNSMKRPRRMTPIANRRRPAIRLARRSPPTPKVCEIGARITTKAAVGQGTCTREPPRSGMRPPATIAV
jgi:hypothetical protein